MLCGGYKAHENVSEEHTHLLHHHLHGINHALGTHHTADHIHINKVET